MRRRGRRGVGVAGRRVLCCSEDCADSAYNMTECDWGADGHTQVCHCNETMRRPREMSTGTVGVGGGTAPQCKVRRPAAETSVGRAATASANRNGCNRRQQARGRRQQFSVSTARTICRAGERRSYREIRAPRRRRLRPEPENWP